MDLQPPSDQPAQQFEGFIINAKHGQELNQQFQVAIQESENASNKLEDTEYSIAEKVFRSGSIEQISLDDVYSFLQSDLGWHVATSNIFNIKRQIDGGRPIVDRELTSLNQLAIERHPNSTLLKYLKEKTIIFKKSIINGRELNEDFDLKKTQEELFGIRQEQSTVMGRAAKNSMLEIANDTAWFPFLVQGLEKGYTLLRNQLPENVVYNQAELAGINKDSQALQDCLNNPNNQAALLGSDYLDLVDTLHQQCGELTEITSPDSIIQANTFISGNDISKQRNELFKALRIWRGGLNQESLIVVEGRYVTNDSNQFGSSEFMIYVIRDNYQATE